MKNLTSIYIDSAVLKLVVILSCCFLNDWIFLVEWNSTPFDFTASKILKPLKMIRQIPDYFFGICSKMGSKNCIKRFRMSSLRWWYFRLKIQAVSKMRAKRKIIHKQMGHSSNQHALFSPSYAQVSHPSTKAATYIIFSTSHENLLEQARTMFTDSTSSTQKLSSWTNYPSCMGSVVIHLVDRLTGIHMLLYLHHQSTRMT